MNDPAIAAEPLLLSLKEGVSICERPDGTVVLQSSAVEVPLAHPSRGLLAALHHLSSGYITEDRIVECVLQSDGSAELPKLFYHLERFIQLGLICHTITQNGNKLAMIVPGSTFFVPAQLAPTQAFTLSRFVYLRIDRQHLVLESPLSGATVILHDHRVAALLQMLATPRTLEQLRDEFQDLSFETLHTFMRLLFGCKGVVETEGEEESLEQWEFHDLLFHTRSRMSQRSDHYGATFRFQGVCDPLPAVKPPMSKDAIDLYRPDIDLLVQEDLPFSQVLEQRRSIRKHGVRPIGIEQLGEFLFRTARVRAIDGADVSPYQRSSRPYPNAGGCYELEIYAVVNVCEGLASGLYHYAPDEHCLYRLSEHTQHLEALLRSAYHASGEHSVPQVLIILTARFQRVAWKYEAIAYALILKHVGVLYQTMYLVATAMGLAPCALGGGDSDLFAAAAGIEHYTEASVGEFMLGSIDRE